MLKSHKTVKICGFFIFILLITGLLFASRPGGNPHGADLGFSCFTCHSPGSWKIPDSLSKFDHDQTGFPLIGAHASLSCRDCHQSLVFSHIGHACADCHSDVHNGEMGIDCERCHTPLGWDNRRAAIEIHLKAGFPLTGAHAVADCEACHPSDRQQYSGTPHECQSCHLEDFRSARNPDHIKAGFETDCRQCHLPSAVRWTDVVYEHTPAFPLTNGHAGLECSDCHGTQYAGTDASCYSCHRDDYLATTDPNHEAFGFPTNCDRCHSTAGWTRAEFDHLTESGFALTGAHATIQCIDCHVNNQISGLPRDCYGCHAEDYNNTTDPDHAAGNFPKDCLQCHNENAWSPSDFDHNLTNFPLTGAHATLACSDCHIDGNYSSMATECYACHAADFTAVTDPNHVSNNFSHVCTECHTTTAWIPVVFDHNTTAFPLTGAHATLACADCHSTGYAGTSTDCYSCHAEDYNGTTDPNHVAAGFSQDCLQCHNENAWTPSTFDHNTTEFPLTGAHATLACADCHSTGYAGTSTDCYSCHAEDYNGATDPNHVAAGFSQDCLQCHNTTAFEPADFDHDNLYFPIYSGSHQGEWNSCADCHTNAADYTQFSCLNCHAHSQSSMDAVHSRVRGYRYESSACYNCHPRGEGK